jgi:hypothetical protein
MKEKKRKERKRKKEKRKKEKEKDTTESFPSYSLVVGKEHRPTFFSELFPLSLFSRYFHSLPLSTLFPPLSLFQCYFPSPSFNVISPSLPLSVIFPPLFLVSMRSLCSRF